jgi:hypothetical protein
MNFQLPDLGTLFSSANGFIGAAGGAGVIAVIAIIVLVIGARVIRRIAGVVIFVAIIAAVLFFMQGKDSASVAHMISEVQSGQGITLDQTQAANLLKDGKISIQSGGKTIDITVDTSSLFPVPHFAVR